MEIAVAVVRSDTGRWRVEPTKLFVRQGLSKGGEQSDGATMRFGASVKLFALNAENSNCLPFDPYRQALLFDAAVALPLLAIGNAFLPRPGARNIVCSFS